MKLIINIPEGEYDEICKTMMHTSSGNPNFYFESKIANGTPIPDNATNGDVIKAMFPDAEIHFNENDVFFHHIGFWIKCNIRWWNSPYQKGDKDEVN